MDTKKLIITFGIITLLISISTWIMDISGLAEPCIYCRNERTVMGLLGLLMILPKHKYLTMYLSLTLGFYGAYVAADQLFNNMLDAKIGLMFSLATGALFIILGQIFVLWVYLFEQNQK
jgi:disulfide bond formation protein DsbB